MRQATARIAGSKDLDGVASLLDEIDFAFIVNHERHAVGDAIFGKINSVILRHFAIEEIA